MNQRRTTNQEKDPQKSIVIWQLSRSTCDLLPLPEGQTLASELNSRHLYSLRIQAPAVWNLAFVKYLVIRALSWEGKDLVPRLILTWKESNTPRWLSRGSCVFWYAKLLNKLNRGSFSPSSWFLAGNWNCCLWRKCSCATEHVRNSHKVYTSPCLMMQIWKLCCE